MADLLLHSLNEFAPLLLRLLDAVRARSVVEIGVEYGGLSVALAERARRLGGWHFGVDPSPKPQAPDLFDDVSSYLLTDTSLNVLEELPAQDAYFLDGDHNYYTVFNELRLIDAAAQEDGQAFPLVFLHDIGWPCARRDMYYAPTSLPAPHPFTYKGGVTPSNPDTIPGGFRGDGQFALAQREGGPKNGVRTAVEDFMAGRSDLFLADIPCIFGLGVLMSLDATAELGQILAPYHRNPLLARMEENRLELYLRVLAQQDRLIAAGL